MKTPQLNSSASLHPVCLVIDRWLFNDVCRCHDATCEVRENCLRWLQRETGHVHSEGMREGQEHSKPCPYQIRRVREGDSPNVSDQATASK